MKKKIWCLIVLGLGVLVGILANRNREHLINAQFIRNHLHFRDAIANKEEILSSPNTMVFLCFGQSNSANYGDGSYVCKNEVYNYYKGDIYHAKEPLLGPDGGGSSVWTRVGDLVVDSGLYKKVVIVPIGLGSTSIQRWVDGDCRRKLDETIDQLIQSNIQLSHIFWVQGETDNVDNTSKMQYKSRLNKLIKIFRDRKITAPFYVALTSYFPYNNTHPLGINPNIIDAQKEIIDERKDVFKGPNTDSLNLAYYRKDAVHFTKAGLNKFAYEWLKNIKEAKN